jgi:hypothetical protein
MEGVRKRATNLLKLLNDGSHENRLYKLHLTTKKNEEDCGETSKRCQMFKQMDNSDVKKSFFNLANAPTREL